MSPRPTNPMTMSSTASAVEDDTHDPADNLENGRAHRRDDVLAGEQAEVIENHDRDDHAHQEEKRLEIIVLGQQGNDGHQPRG